jgi:hypothetical protein
MRDTIILELASRWEKDAKEPQCCDGSPEAQLSNGRASGMREAKRECADTLRTLVELLGDRQ